MQLNAGEAFAVPFAFLNGVVCLWDITGHSQHHAAGVLGSSNSVAFWCVYYHDTASSSSRNVDVVNANAGTADYFQISGSVDNFLCYLCLAAWLPDRRIRRCISAVLLAAYWFLRLHQNVPAVMLPLFSLTSSLTKILMNKTLH